MLFVIAVFTEDQSKFVIEFRQNGLGTSGRPSVVQSTTTADGSMRTDGTKDDDRYMKYMTFLIALVILLIVLVLIYICVLYLQHRSKRGMKTDVTGK